MKELHGVHFDGITFGMTIDPKSKAYSFFKKNVKDETVIDARGIPFVGKTVSHTALGAIMHEAHWLVTELKDFDWVWIDGLYGEAHIYVKYDDEPIDFRTRHEKNGDNWRKALR